MSEPVKVFTLKATCKKCDEEFTYTRIKTLTGLPRQCCDTCIRNRHRTRSAPIWKNVIHETTNEEG